MFIYYWHGLFIPLWLLHFDFWKCNTRTLLINMEQNSHENVKGFNITRTHPQCNKENKASVGLFCTLFESFQLSTRCHFYVIITVHPRIFIESLSVITVHLAYMSSCRIKKTFPNAWSDLTIWTSVSNIDLTENKYFNVLRSPFKDGFLANCYDIMRRSTQQPVGNSIFLLALHCFLRKHHSLNTLIH